MYGLSRFPATLYRIPRKQAPRLASPRLAFPDLKRVAIQNLYSPFTRSVMLRYLRESWCAASPHQSIAMLS